MNKLAINNFSGISINISPESEIEAIVPNWKQLTIAKHPKSKLSRVMIFGIC
jgi:hypothetical protein